MHLVQAYEGCKYNTVLNKDDAKIKPMRTANIIQFSLRMVLNSIYQKRKKKERLNINYENLERKLVS